jgi:hypothetical protein
MSSNPVISQPISRPSGSLIAPLAKELGQYLPFDQMLPEHVNSFVAQSQQRYYPAGQQVMSLANGLT